MLALLSLWPRRGARMAFDMVMTAHRGFSESQMHAGISPRCLSERVFLVTEEQTDKNGLKRAVFVTFATEVTGCLQQALYPATHLCLVLLSY